MPGFSREGRKPNRGGRLSRLWIIVSLAEHNGNDQATIPRTIEPFGRSPSRLAYHRRGNAVPRLLGVAVQLLIGQADEIAQCFLYARVFYALQQFAIAQDFGAQLCRIIVAHLPRKCGELGASSRPRLGLMRVGQLSREDGSGLGVLDRGRLLINQSRALPEFETLVRVMHAVEALGLAQPSASSRASKNAALAPLASTYSSR
jgi:hypothetical protein